MDLIKRFDNYTDSLMPRWIRDSLIIFIIFCFSFYYFYGEITPKWRFFGNAVIAIPVSITIHFILVFISGRIHNHNMRKISKEVCLEIDIQPDSVDEEDIKIFKKYLIQRYSSDKFSNRITNFIGNIMYLSSWIVELLVIGSILFLLFYIPINKYYYDDLSMWYPVMWYVVFWLFSMLVYFLSKIIFNRYPREASDFFKVIDK